MSDLGAIVKDGAEDMAQGGEKAGAAIVKHFEGIGSELENAGERYRGVESDIENSFTSVTSDGAQDAEHLAGDAEHDAATTARDASGSAADDGKSLASETEAEQAEDARLNGEDGSGGDPVDVVTGEMFLMQRDLVLPGVLPLVLERRFASGSRRGRWFGARWSSTLDQRIEIDDEGIHCALADGRVLHYPVPAVHGEQVMASFGPRWPLVWDRAEGRDEVRIEQGDLGRTLIFRPGPTPEVCRPLSAVVDRGGNRHTFVYDADGVPTDVYCSGGYHLRIESAGTRGGPRISAIGLADPAGGADLPVREFRYDPAGRLTETCHPDSPLPLVFEHDEADRITAWTDRNGHWYRYTYREDGRVAVARGENGYLDATFDYDLEARTTTTTDALGHARVYHWNAAGQGLKTVDPLGGERRTEQDRHGYVVADTDQLGHTTRIARDPLGDPVRIENPDGTSTLIEYDERRLPVRAAHSDGRAWTYEHGLHGKVTAITNPLGAVVRFDYDERGHLLRSIDPLGAATAYRCDRAGLPVEATDALGAVTVIRRDAFGRIVEIVDAEGASTRTDWSPGGRLVRTRYPDGATEQWEYDPEGNVLSITGPTGACTAFTYGPFDKPTSRTDPSGSAFRFAYDAELHLTTVTGPTGQTWSYEYDDAGRLVAESDFDGVRIGYRLDAAGQLTARTSPAGAVEFTRDPAGRLVERRVGEHTARFAYGIAGQLQRAETHESVLEYTFDALGQVLSETSDGRTVANAYDAAGRRIERTTPSGVITRWTYDAVGQHTTMAGSAGSLAFAYDRVGRETSRLLGAGALAHRTYDVAGRLLTEGIWAYPHQDAAAASPDNTPVQLQARIYSYLPDGAPEEIQDALRGTRRFELDAAGRVTRVQAASWQASYAYDPAGNLAEAADPVMSEDSAGAREIRGTRIKRAGRSVYEYDDAGRLVRRTRRTLSGQTRIWRFTWDAEGRLTETALPGGETWRYAYDPLGRRVAKARHGADGTALETVRFDWDGPRLAEETTTDPAGRTGVRTWDYQPGGFAPLAQTRRAWADGASQAEIDAEFHAIVTDLVGTPTELVTPGGEIAWYTTASVWGESVAAAGSTADCPLRFPGQYHDAETGLDYNLHRYYDPDLGAYLSPDPLGLAPAANNTAYVGNPLIEFDPLGLFSCPVKVQQELAQFRQDTNMKSVAQEDAEAQAIRDAGKKPRGVQNTVGKMEFDGGREPVYGVNGRLAERTDAYPGKGNGMSAISYQDHAEGDMAYQASQRGYSGGSAAIYTDRDTCNFCANSMSGYARSLNLDSITVYDPTGLVGVWDQTGKIG